MKLKTIRDLDPVGKRVLVRVDFNVPFDDDGGVSNARRIRATLPTLEHCLDAGARLILMTHIGRPGGEPDDKLRTGRVAGPLRDVLNGKPVETVIGREDITIA